MIQLSAGAVGVIVDAAVVELERRLAGVDGDRHRPVDGHGLLQRVLVTLRDVHVSHVGGADVLLVEAAGFVLRLVRIRGLGVEAAVGLDVFEGIVHQTSVTAVVTEAGAAVDQVLFAEGDEPAGLAEVLSLQRAGGGEGPARAALALILDGSDGALGAPVNAGGQLDLGRQWKVCRSLSTDLLMLAVAVHHHGKFVIREVSVLVDLQLVAVLTCLIALVMLVDQVLVAVEDHKPEIIFFLRRVVLSMCDLERLPLFGRKMSLPAVQGVELVQLVEVGPEREETDGTCRVHSQR